MSEQLEQQQRCHAGDPARAPDSALAELMGLDTDDAQWPPEDLTAIYQHQLRSALQYDLVEAGVISRGKLEMACGGTELVTFGDLLGSAAPPAEVVAAVKQFAKGMALLADSPIPPQVARVLYFVAIALSQVRCGQAITRLPGKDLRHGLEWALRRPWIDEGTRGVLRAAIT